MDGRRTCCIDLNLALQRSSAYPSLVVDNDNLYTGPKGRIKLKSDLLELNS